VLHLGLCSADAVEDAIAPLPADLRQLRADGLPIGCGKLRVRANQAHLLLAELALHQDANGFARQADVGPHVFDGC
jgi:hypothetical protein